MNDPKNNNCFITAYPVAYARNFCGRYVFGFAAFALLICAVFLLRPVRICAATPTYSFSQVSAEPDSVTLNWSFSNTDEITFTDLSLTYGTNTVDQVDTVTIPSVTNTSCTLTGLDEGTVYYIRLLYEFYYNENPDVTYSGSTSAITAGTIPSDKPSWIKYDFGKSQKSLRVSWDAIGCDYQIRYQYQLKNRNGKLLKEAIVSSCPITFKDYYKQPYTFRVRSVAVIAGKVYYGPWSAVKKIVPQPLLAASTKKNRITKQKTMKLSWSKVYGASGYKIYISTKRNSGFTCVKTVKSKVLSVTLKTYKKKKFKFNKPYYVKVVATTKKYGASNLNYGLKLILKYK